MFTLIELSLKKKYLTIIIIDKIFKINIKCLNIENWVFRLISR